VVKLSSSSVPFLLPALAINVAIILIPGLLTIAMAFCEWDGATAPTFVGFDNFRAIVADPTFLLCDEPTGDLDRKSADEIMGLIIRLVKEYGKTVLMVTHDPVVAKLADLELHLEKGLLVEGHQVEQNAYAGGAA